MQLIKNLLSLILWFKCAVNGHRLTPIDGSIIHCAGQTNQDFSDGDGFTGYSNYLNGTTRPSMYMIYSALNGMNVEWFNELNSILNGFGPNQYTGVQLGLWFSGMADQVANGEMDGYINAMINGIQLIERPFLIRIGYEFNGEWNNYPPNSYKQAYIRITNMLRSNNFTNEYVATVWDYSTDAQNLNYMEWYPGDEYVDWWGVNIFSGPSGPTSNLVTSLGFPVLLGESTPRFTGVNNGEISWNSWFQGYFYSLIFNQTNGIRGFCYINWNWKYVI